MDLYQQSDDKVLFNTLERLNAGMRSPSFMCNPVGLLHPQDSPGKNTGVGSYALLIEVEY